MQREIMKRKRKTIFIAQVASLALIWVFVIAIAFWIINLLLRSIELRDALEATIGISIVAIPVFLTLAGVLTYVFIGLQKEERRLSAASSED